MGPTKPDKLLRRPFSDEPIAKYGAETHIQPRARDRHFQDWSSETIVVRLS